MFTKTKMVATGVVVAGVVCTGCYISGSYNAIDNKMEQLEASNRQQQEYIEYLKAEGIKYEKFVNSVSQEVELVLFTEDGIVNTVVENGSNFLTKTKTEFAIEYRVKLGIKTDDIHFAKRGESIVITVDRDDIEVNSLEIINKNILKSHPKLFSRYMTDDEKIAAEKLIVEKAKEEVLNNKNIELAIDGFVDYMNGLAEVAEVEINFIIH